MATYFVSESGSDSNTGYNEAIPIRTLEKVNSLSLVPGDSVLFKRGDTWAGQLTYLKGGSIGSPVVYGAYGVGDKPIISGFQTLTGWTDIGGGIYSASTTALNSLNVVTVNGTIQAKGRYPNSGFLTIDSHVSNTSITDSALAGQNWVGAEVVIRTARWKYEKKTILTHVGSTITFSAVEETLQDGWGYFIQNSLQVLDSSRDWFCADGTFYMYFGAANPADFEVKVAAYEDLITISNRTYTTVENLKITGVNNRGINVNNASTDILINACDFEFINVGAVYMYGSGTISNCSVNYALNRAFYVEGINSTIRSNSIWNTGLIRGMGSIYTAISCTGAGTLIEKNRITNTGYDGIHFTGSNITVKNNMVDNFCTILDDGGGIYTGSAAYTGRVIDGNIVRNANSAKDSTGETSESGFGIYLDEGAANISITNNTVERCSNSGILLHFAASVDITGNNVFDCPTQLYLSNNYSSAYADMSNINISGNNFVAKYATQVCFKFLSVKNDLSFGSASGNVYARPIDDTNVFNIDTYNTSATAYDLAGWKMISGYDATSTKSPKTIVDASDISIVYNDTDVAEIVSLGSAKMGMDGTIYVSEITLQPFTSAVLINHSSNIKYLIDNAGKYLIGSDGKYQYTSI